MLGDPLKVGPIDPMQRRCLLVDLLLSRIALDCAGIQPSQCRRRDG